MIDSSITTKRYNKLIEILGKRYINGNIHRPFDFIKIAGKGINANVINNFRSHFDLPLEITSSMLNISEPTIYRWIRENKKLDRNVAVKLFHLTELFIYGTEVFGSQENFLIWLNHPSIALGRMKPIELLDIPDGISQVRDEIGRIEHGILA